MSELDDRPFYRLTRHFFEALFDLGFLSDKGSQGLTRLILGVVAVFLALGLLLLRIFAMKYGSLAGASEAEYSAAVLADHAFLIGVPMWIVAFVTTLVGHAVFPDETDFRVLMALPVTRRFVFGAKLTALVLFGGLFVTASHVALAPLFLLTSFGPWAESWIGARAVAFWSASLLGSITAALSIVACQGVLMMAVPRGHVAGAAAAARSALLFGLVLTLPFVARLPVLEGAFRRGDLWLAAVPPAWCVGLERLLLGDASPALVRAAAAGALASTAAALVSGAAYLMLYRRFDRTMWRSAETSALSRADAARVRWRRPLRRPARAAIRTFVGITLRRSVLHQGIVVALSAIGTGLVVNSLIGADVATAFGDSGPGRRLTRTLYWAPFALVFVSAFAVRTALLVPIEQRANWIFRVIEQGPRRVDQLAAAPGAVWAVGVAAPVLALTPLQWMVIGPHAMAAPLVGFVAGWLYVEILLRDWDRIPFTCSFIPAKGFLPQTILIGLFSFVLFTTIGTGVAQVAAAGYAAAWGIILLMAAAAAVLCWRRRRTWAYTPLAFEDYVPSEVHPLKLRE